MRALIIFTVLCFLLAIKLSDAAKDKSSSKGSSSKGTSSSKGSGTKTVIKTTAAKVASKGYSYTRQRHYYRDRHYWRRHRPRGYVAVTKEQPDDDDDYEGLRCYACKGRDNDACARGLTGPMDTVQCPRNHYCAVVRTEYPPLTEPEKTAVEATTTPSPAERHGLVLLNNPDEPPICKGLVFTEKSYRSRNESEYWKSMMLSFGCARHADPVNGTTISRECRSYEYIQKSLAEAKHGDTTSSENSTTPKVYATYCDENYCNTGDGRLRCYECEGIGENDTCMRNIANDSKIVTCKPNEFCSILRMVSVAHNSSVANDTSDGLVIVTRGCSVYSPIEYHEEEIVIDGTPWKGVLAINCASDFCNSIDENLLTGGFNVNSTPGNACPWKTVFLVMVTSLTSLIRQISPRHT